MLKVKISEADGFLIVSKEEQDLFEKLAEILDPNQPDLIRLMDEKQSLT